MGGHALTRALAVASVLFATFGQSTSAQQRQESGRATIVIEGANAETWDLRRLRDELGARRVVADSASGLQVWEAPGDLTGSIRARLAELAARNGWRIDDTSLNYRSVLGPQADAPPLTPAQSGAVAALRRQGQTDVRVVYAPPQSLGDYAFDRGFTRRDGFADNNSLRVEFDRTRAFDLTRDSGSEQSSDGAWIGVGAGGERANLTYADGDVSGFINTPDSVVEVRPLGNGAHALIERPRSRADDEPADFMQRVPILPPPALDVEPGRRSEVDVLVVYTQEAAVTAPDRARTFGADRIRDLNNVVKDANLQNVVHFNLVGVEPVAFSEAQGWGHNLQALVNPRDGELDIVHELRRQHSADIVIMIVAEGAPCGEAAAVGIRADLAFAMVRESCFTNFSFEHEVGHLFGLRHDLRTDPETHPDAWVHGFLMPDFHERTIMAYARYCDCDRIQRWSDPRQRYHNAMFGSAEWEDEARAIAASAAAVASHF